MSEQPEALRIAEWFEGGYGGCESEAAAELRRLHEVNQELLVEASPSYDWHRFACEAAAAIRARGESK